MRAEEAAGHAFRAVGPTVAKYRSDCTRATIGRRAFMGYACALAARSVSGRVPVALPSGPRQRIIVDNDFPGDPDGLFQLAHHLASPATRVELVIGSHLRPLARADRSERQADNGAERARAVMDRMRLVRRPRVIAGRNAVPLHGQAPEATPAVKSIIAEAMRDDDLPLFYAAGAGLTDLAEAVRLAPAIAERMTLVWIGGPSPSDMAAPAQPEYNLAIDVEAARTLFNDSATPIWQVPREVYRTLLVSHAELERELRGAGMLRRYLLDALERALRDVYGSMGETYILGDSPLVTLTALQSSFDPDSSSSAHGVTPTPRIDALGGSEGAATGRPMRVYRSIDARLTFADMFAKLRSASR